MGNAARHHYDHYARTSRLTQIGSWSVLLLVCAVLALAPLRSHAEVVHVIGIVAGVTAAFFLVRSFRWATIDIGGREVVVRGLFADSKLPVDDIARFVVVRGENSSAEPVGAIGVRKRDGASIVFDDFTRTTGDASGPLDGVVVELNRWIAEEHAERTVA